MSRRELTRPATVGCEVDHGQTGAAGLEVSEALILVMTDKGLNSLMASSFKIEGDASIAAGPVGAGAKATVTADIVAFARANGLYGGVNLDGAVARQPPCNDAYYNGQGQQRAPSRHRYTQDVAEREVKRLASEVVNAAK